MVSPKPKLNLAGNEFRIMVYSFSPIIEDPRLKKSITHAPWMHITEL
jgi:hypothetical protein